MALQTERFRIPSPYSNWAPRPSYGTSCERQVQVRDAESFRSTQFTWRSEVDWQPFDNDCLAKQRALGGNFLGFAILGGCSADREVTGHVLVVTKGGREHKAGRGGPPFFRWERFSSGRVKNFRGNEAIQGSPFSLARKRVQAKRSGSWGSKTCKYLTSQSERPTRLVPSTNRKHLACRAIMLLNSRCPYNHGH